jgi:hypothetical protein
LKVVREVSDNEIWCEWLKTEYKERIDKKFHQMCEELTNEPDFSNQDDNNQRRKLLIPIRGTMMERIPKGTRWYLVELDADDYQELYILGWWTFKILSDFTGRLSVASKNLIDSNYKFPSEILSRISTSDFDHHRKKVNGILAKRTYEKEFKPLLLGRNFDKAPTIIDGCHRSLALYAACFVKGEYQYSPIQAYLGIIGRKRSFLGLQPDTRLRRKNRRIQIECYGQAKGLGIAKQMLKSKIGFQDMFLTRHGLPSFGTFYLDEIENFLENRPEKVRESLIKIEEKYDKIYLDGLISLIPEEFKPAILDEDTMSRGVNNPFELSLRISIGQAFLALMSANLEPYLGFLHAPELGWPGIINILSLSRDFVEIYRPVYDDYIVGFLRKIHDKKSLMSEPADIGDLKKVYLSDGDYSLLLAGLAGLHGMRSPPMSIGSQPSLDTITVQVVTRNNLSFQLRREARLLSKYLRCEIEEWTPGNINIPYKLY